LSQYMNAYACLQRAKFWRHFS